MQKRLPNDLARIHRTLERTTAATHGRAREVVALEVDKEEVEEKGGGEKCDGGGGKEGGWQSEDG